MPAKLTIQSGISAGASHWIERPVIRVGSHPQSDVCLPSADVPSQALTVEFRDGRYRVYNRCERDILIGSQPVAPGSVADWPDTDILQLTNEVSLVLDVDDDPTPMPMKIAADYAYDEDEPNIEQQFDADSTDAAASADRSKTLLQIAVIAMCLLGAVGLLARRSMRTATEQRDPPSFAKVVRDAIASDTTSSDLIQRLQYAESATVRGNKTTARERYGSLRDDLVPQKDTLVAGNREPELAILDFVEYRLGQLE